MARDNPVSRRTALKITGAAASTALVAGCSSGGNGDGNGNGNGNGNGGGASEYEAEAGEEIMFDAQTSHWEGVSPSDIQGSENPTLILSEGEEYTIGWNQGNGQPHNIEIRNDSGEVVGDHSTDQTSEEEPSDQTLTFTASSEMAQYVCQPHSSQMVGDITVE